MNQDDNELSLGNVLFQNIFGILRVSLFVYILVFFASRYSTSIHEISPLDIAQNLRQSNPIFTNSPQWLVVFFASLINPYVFRYILLPLSAMVCVLFLGAFYVKDVYALPSLGNAFHYVVASMFTIGYSQLKVDKGVKQLKKGEINLIERIGGPGSVLIEPGSAAIFQQLRSQSGCMISGTYFLRPFETIAHTVDLDEQQGDKDEVKCMTRDGIKVTLRDIHFRYRIKADSENGVPARRNFKKPYPFAGDALVKRTYNLAVLKDGAEESWNAAVEGPLTAQIADFIAEHTIDYLTAPRENDTWPREELRNFVCSKAKTPLDNLGAELLWVDVGHIEIVEETVNNHRTSVWAADWIGDSTVARAYGEAKRLAYQEMGRAEAQAELIISIADALCEAKIPNDSSSKENIRKLLLARTAQVLDSMASYSKVHWENRL